MEAYHHLEDMTNEILPRESRVLDDEIREVELLRPKLQYEITTLLAKVDEVEEWVGGFGRQVEELERRIIALEPSNQKKGWVQWALSWVPFWNTNDFIR